MVATHYSFQTIALKTEMDYLAPDGSEIRLLPTLRGGGLCHCTLPTGKTSAAVMHKRVEEIWYVLGGEGEVWRKAGNHEETISVRAGTSLTIPPRTAFQFRNTGTTQLQILIVTMPPWPGQQEALPTAGPWATTAASDGAPSASTPPNQHALSMEPTP